MASKFGHFAGGGAEYVILRPDTPRPWVNYLTNGEYCALCSHVGGGFSFYKDHRYNSVLRRGPSQAVEDLPARLVYVKDEETGEFWTINSHPIGKHDSFTARHGMGSTQISSRYQGIQGDLKLFVPPAINAEIWDIAVRNHSDRQRKLSVYTYADFALGNVSLEDHEGTFMSLFNDYTLSDDTILIRKKWWHPNQGWSEDNGIWQYRAFMTATRKPVKILTDRNVFLGAFHTPVNPSALDSEILPDCVALGKPAAGVFQWRVELAPGEEWDVHVSIGVQENNDSDENCCQLESLHNPVTYEKAWAETTDYWSQLFSSFQIETPDPEINQMLNHWNKYQVMINFHFGRGPSYYHKGQYPAMRDSCQDAFGVIPLSPKMARKQILRIAGFFFKDGRACGGCNRIGLPEGPSEKVDLPLWFVLVVADYLRETGDFAFLDEVSPLMDGGSSTVYEKMIAGIERMIGDRGPHGLPLIGKGDWNDAANAIGVKGKGESVWLAQFLYFAIQEILPIMDRRGEAGRQQAYRDRAAEIRGIVNEKCWDGEWFVRAFKDDGTPVGVRGQKEAFIWINSQTWAVISGISDPERLNQCMDSAEKYLGTEYGMMNLGPAFSEIDETIGIITRFPHGWKENAAVFSHASAFNVVARAMLGRGEDAVDLMKRLLPSSKDPEHYQVEPYVYSQFCAGPSTGDDFGRGAYHWLTGTAAWMIRAMMDYVLGVHPEFDGLRINPAVSASWKQFKLVREFRGATYEILFENPDGVQTGIREILLDGTPIAGNILPLPTADRHVVRVLMGKR